MTSWALNHLNYTSTFQNHPENLLLYYVDLTLLTMMLSSYNLSIWDVVAQGWRRPQGTIGVTVGASSHDKRLKSTLHFNA